MTLSKDTFDIARTGPGVLRGYVLWNKGLGAVLKRPMAPHLSVDVPPCYGVRLDILASNGPHSEVSVMPHYFSFAGPLTYQDAGTQHRCDFEVQGLPVGVPLRIAMSPSPAWLLPNGQPPPSALNFSFDPNDFANDVTISATRHDLACNGLIVPLHNGGGTYYCPNAINNLRLVGATHPIH